MRTLAQVSLLLSLGMLFLSGCDSAPGRPAQGAETLAPDQILQFDTLYSENCAGCHGKEGHGGAAIALGDPVYLAVVNEDIMRKVVTNGIKGTSMAAFGQSAGGMLTDKQIDVIVTQIRSRWAKPGILGGTNPPSYLASTQGDAARGAIAYKTFCESCHGPDGRGTPKGSSITDGSFLALLTDQELRTMVIVGRPDRGAPDWRNDVPGKPMTDQEITDVIAWLASKRVSTPGQPYPTASSVQP
ncbi:MAG TPA: c-type cytochrome [Candidatus Eisenbacteria bacterium]|nr:c-type cytochrome [Candidatus Eisenbacteria bacterium]